MNIQSFNFGNVSVSFRDDGYLNATAIAAHFGKRVPDFIKTEQNQEYINALAEHISKTTKIVLDRNQLVIVKHGGNNRGTWLHPKLAIHFARWLDPKFAVWCDEQIEQIISGSLQPKLAQTTVADRTPLRQAVSALVGRCGFDYSAAYHLVHQRFGVGSIEEIAAEDLPEAVEYVHMLTVYGGMCGEVLEKQPAPQGVVLTERQMGHFAAGAYMLDLATRRLADLSEPLKMLGARDKGVSAWTIRDEAEIWIKNCRSALEAVLPQMGDNFYRGSVQESLRMMDVLAAR